MKLHSIESYKTKSNTLLSIYQCSCTKEWIFPLHKHKMMIIKYINLILVHDISKLDGWTKVPLRWIHYSRLYTVFIPIEAHALIEARGVFPGQNAREKWMLSERKLVKHCILKQTYLDHLSPVFPAINPDVWYTVFIPIEAHALIEARGVFSGQNAREK